jgi:hypothetical protein
MDEEFKSFLVTNPDIIDEGIDVSGIRQATEQDKLIAGAIAEEPGLAYDPRLTSYLSDLNRYFSGGFPTISTPPTTTPTPPTGGDGGGGGDPGTDGGSGPRGRLTDSGTFGGQPTFTTTPGTTVDNITGDITNPDGTYGGNIVDEVTLTGSQSLLDSTSTAEQIAQDLSNQQAMLNPTGGNIMDEVTLTGGDTSYVDPIMDPNLMSIRQQQNIDGLTTPQSNTLRSIASKVGGDLTQFGKEIASIPGAVFDSLSNTVEVFGEKFNIGKTAAGLVMNKLAGGPISLVFAVGDVLGSALPSDPRANALREFYDVDTAGTIQSGIMKGYNPVSGGLLNAITGGAAGKETNYGLQDAIQGRINTIEESLGKFSKYDPTSPDYDPVKTKQQLDKLDELRDLKDREKSVLDAASAAGTPEALGGPGTYGEGLTETSTADQIASDLAAQQEAEDISGDNIMDEFAPENKALKDAISGDIGVEGEEEGRFTDRGMKDQSDEDTSPTDIPDREMGITEGQLKSQVDQSGEQIGTLKELEEMEDLYATGTNIMRDFDFDQSGGGISQNEAAGKAAEDAQREAIQDAARTGMSVNQAKASVGMPENLGDTGGGKGNEGKIVCTMMNESYGFGSFRNKIWMKFHKDLSPEYQKGYHKLFLPLVKIAKKNKIVKKVLEHIAVHSTIDMRQATRGKTHLLGRVYRKILLPLCYWVGKYVK